MSDVVNVYEIATVIHEAVYEVLPCTRLAMEAPIEKAAINFRQGHRHTFWN